MTEHEKKYTDLCERHGVKWNEESPRLVGETLETMAKKYKEDENLNNVWLERWDRLAIGFMSLNRGHGLSLAECVCMHKHAAKTLLKEKGLI